MKKTSHILTAVAMLSLASAVTAAENAAENAADKPAAQQGLQVKSKSSFNATPGMHNPFWPIGWSKQAPVKVATVVKTAQGISATGFTVSSIFLGNPAIAVINGRDYQEGDMIRINGVKTEVQVVAIRDGEVVLRSGESQVSIKQKRN